MWPFLFLFVGFADSSIFPATSLKESRRIYLASNSMLEEGMTCFSMPYSIARPLSDINEADYYVKQFRSQGKSKMVEFVYELFQYLEDLVLETARRVCELDDDIREKYWSERLDHILDLPLKEKSFESAEEEKTVRLQVASTFEEINETYERVRKDLINVWRFPWFPGKKYYPILNEIEVYKAVLSKSGRSLSLLGNEDFMEELMNGAMIDDFKCDAKNKKLLYLRVCYYELREGEEAAKREERKRVADERREKKLKEDEDLNDTILPEGEDELHTEL